MKNQLEIQKRPFKDVKNTLKYTFTLVSILFLLQFIVACDDFVEVDLPKNQLLTDAVFDESGTANAAMSDIYAKIRDNGILTGNNVGISMTLGLYTDELRFHGNQANTAVNYFNNALLPTGIEIATYWNNSYNQIYAANSVIEGTMQSEILPQADKDQLQGEALFVRALVHSYLTGIFGSVPYVKSTDLEVNLNIGKKMSQEVYELCIADLKTAIPLLPDDYITAHRERPNKYAAYALLARLSLYAGQYTEAVDAATTVLNHTQLYGVETNLNLVFRKESRSTVWQLAPRALNGNTLQGTGFIFTSAPPTFASLTPALLNAFEAGDQRKELWTKTVSNANGSWSHAFKYKQRGNTSSTSEMSVVLRLGELYLIRAEAKTRSDELIEAKADLDFVRGLAGLGASSADMERDLLTAIAQERRVELFTEYGHRFFDLKRFGALDATLSGYKPGWEPTDSLFPIPEVEISLNPNLNPQNLGY